MKHYPFYIFLFSQNSYQIAIFLTVSALWKAFQPFVDISLPYSSLCGSSRTICRCLFPEARILLRLQSYRQVSLPLSTTLLPLHQSHPIYKVQTYHLLLRKAGNIRSTLQICNCSGHTQIILFSICCIFGIIFRSSMNCVDIFQSQFFDHSIQELNSFVQ